jgi:hypothetical protein
VPSVDLLHALVPEDELADLHRTLRRRLTEDELRTTLASPGTYAVRDERLRDDLTAARHGGVLAAVLGVVVGLAIAFATDATSVAQYLLFAGGGAALAGLIGAVVGMQRHEVLDDDPAATRTVTVADGLQLLEIRSERFGIWAHRVLLARPGVTVLDSAELVVDETPRRLRS